MTSWYGQPFRSQFVLYRRDFGSIGPAGATRLTRSDFMLHYRLNLLLPKGAEVFIRYIKFYIGSIKKILQISYSGAVKTLSFVFTSRFLWCCNILCFQNICFSVFIFCLVFTTWCINQFFGQFYISSCIYTWQSNMFILP